MSAADELRSTAMNLAESGHYIVAMRLSRIAAEVEALCEATKPFTDCVIGCPGHYAVTQGGLVKNGEVKAFGPEALVDGDFINLEKARAKLAGEEE